MSASIDDYRWLLSDAAEKWLQHARSDACDVLATAKRLRRDLSPERTHLVLQQAELRRRARVKFVRAEEMFFTPTTLEQATDERIAEYKAARFDGCSHVADLCCGLGGDLLALGRRAPAVGVEKDDVVSLCAAENCRRLGEGKTHVLREDATHFALNEVAAWHVDPDRRHEGSRTSQIEFGSPDVNALERMLQQNGTAAIKMAPAATTPPAWRESISREWIQSRGECRQQVAWLGGLALTDRQQATMVDSAGDVHSFSGDPTDHIACASAIGKFCHEPAAAVIAARLTDALGNHCGCLRIAKQVAYLTSDHSVEHPLLTSFQVLDCLPFDLKQLRGYFRQHAVGHVEVKKRGVDCNPAQLQQQLASGGDASVTLLLTPHGRGVVGIVAKRMSSST